MLDKEVTAIIIPHRLKGVAQVFIEIEDLTKEPLHFRHIFPMGEILLAHEDATLSEPVGTDFILTHDDRSLHIDGSVETGIRCTCSRCLKQFSRHLTAPFDLSYLPQPKVPREGEEIELRYEDMEVGFYDGVRLDVNLMVLEQIELALPMKFVCCEECKGLCYKCGADLNEGQCRCDNTEMDSRLRALLQFRNKPDEAEK
jgi:uncharacterized protein